MSRKKDEKKNVGTNGLILEYLEYCIEVLLLKMLHITKLAHQNKGLYTSGIMLHAQLFAITEYTGLGT